MSSGSIDGLLKNIQENNCEKSFNELFRLLYTKLFNFAFSFTQSEVVSEEIVMDTFLKLWSSRASIASIKKIDTYLFVIVKNLSITYLKRKKINTNNLLDKVVVNIPGQTYSPEQTLIDKASFEKLNRIVQELPPKCKLIFKLIREERLERKEVAKILNISVKTIDAQMAIAVERIALGLNIDVCKKENRIRRLYLSLF
jgi:RNA polymerase sigma-70 factor (ECF subfamily)